MCLSQLTVTTLASPPLRLSIGEIGSTNSILVLTCLLSATAYAQKVSIDYDKQANFSSYKTYMWAEGTPAKNPLGHQRIIAGIEAQLAAKGWQKVENDSDISSNTRNEVMRFT